MAGMRNFFAGRPVSLPEGTLVPIGDRRRITALFESLRPELLRFACWLARDRQIAEDVVQESLLRAWRSRDSLKDAASAKAWLFTIVRREHARLYERRSLDLVALEDSMLESELPVDDDSEIHSLRAAILRLPLEYREPLIMQVIGGFSTEEIAHELGISGTAALTRLFRARNKLREMLDTAAAETRP